MSTRKKTMNNMETIKIGSRGEVVKTAQKALNVYPDGIYGKLTEEAVKDFQKEHGITADGIVGAKTWELILSGDTSGKTADVALPKLKKSKRTIKRIIVHCTATPEGRDVSVETIRRWHKERGWSDIGYHYVVMLDGTIKNGRDVDIAGAHTQGYNSTSIGVVYVGGMTNDAKKSKDTRTDAQKKALVGLLKKLRALYPSATIHGHSEFANKACPCFSPSVEYKDIFGK